MAGVRFNTFTVTVTLALAAWLLSACPSDEGNMVAQIQKSGGGTAAAKPATPPAAPPATGAPSAPPAGQPPAGANAPLGQGLGPAPGAGGTQANQPPPRPAGSPAPGAPAPGGPGLGAGSPPPGAPAGGSGSPVGGPSARNAVATPPPAKPGETVPPGTDAAHPKVTIEIKDIKAPYPRYDGKGLYNINFMISVTPPVDAAVWKVSALDDSGKVVGTHTEQYLLLRETPKPLRINAFRCSHAPVALKFEIATDKDGKPLVAIAAPPPGQPGTNSGGSGGGTGGTGGTGGSGGNAGARGGTGGGGGAGGGGAGGGGGKGGSGGGGGKGGSGGGDDEGGGGKKGGGGGDEG